jgi:hypothetical protein
MRSQIFLFKEELEVFGGLFPLLFGPAFALMPNMEHLINRSD